MTASASRVLTRQMFRARIAEATNECHWDREKLRYDWAVDEPMQLPASNADAPAGASRVSLATNARSAGRDRNSTKRQSLATSYAEGALPHPGIAGSGAGTARGEATEPRHFVSRGRFAQRTGEWTKCRFPGCECGMFLEAHYAKHWAHGGETSMDSLLPLCPFHHRCMREYGYSTKIQDGQPTFYGPNGKAPRRRATPLPMTAPASRALTEQMSGLGNTSATNECQRAGESFPTTGSSTN